VAPRGQRRRVAVVAARLNAMAIVILRCLNPVTIPITIPNPEPNPVPHSDYGHPNVRVALASQLI